MFVVVGLCRGYLVCYFTARVVLINMLDIFVFKYKTKGAAAHYFFFPKPVIGNPSQSKQEFLMRYRFSNFMWVGGEGSYYGVRAK